MSEPGSRRGRIRDAEGAREAILNAAEAAFAEHGFDGARIDAIAAMADYNKSLIFQYFDDKLNLYAEVMRRADKGMSELQDELQTDVFASIFGNDITTFNAHQFRTFLETSIGAIFDYLIGHPRLLRIMLWEQAEGWQTYAKIASQFGTDDLSKFEQIFSAAQSAGLLRSSYMPIVQLTTILQVCKSYLAFVPLYQILLPDEDFSSDAAHARARQYILEFIVGGMMVDPPQTKP